MTTDFRSETYDLSTDTHLAERARFGSTPAFDELVSRHAEHAVAMAMVVTGDARAAVTTGSRAFTDVLDQMASGGYSADDPYLPGLLRSSRELALTDPTADPALRQPMEVKLPELARSTRWLTASAGVGALDLALAFDVEDHAIAGIVAWSDALIANHADAVDFVLGNVRVLIPVTFPADARGEWRRWLATSGVSATMSSGAAAGRFAAIEPVASRILRGAAVVLIVAGLAGTAVGVGRLGGEDGGSTTLAQRASVERPMPNDNVGSDPGITGFDTTAAQAALANAGVGPVASATVESMATASSDVQVLGAMVDASPAAAWAAVNQAVLGHGVPVPVAATAQRRAAARVGRPGTTSSPSTASRPPTTASAAPAPPALPAPAPAASKPSGKNPAATAPKPAATAPKPVTPAGKNPAATAPKPAPPAPTKPPATTPPKPVTPAPTKPPATTPPRTAPPAITPPSTTPPATTPAVTSPPVTTPPVTTPPVTVPPVTVPPVTLPPVTVPPAVGPIVGGVTGTDGGLAGGLGL